MEAERGTTYSKQRLGEPVYLMRTWLSQCRGGGAKHNNERGWYKSKEAANICGHSVQYISTIKRGKGLFA